MEDKKVQITVMPPTVINIDNTGGKETAPGKISRDPDDADNHIPKKKSPNKGNDINE